MGKSIFAAVSFSLHYPFSGTGIFSGSLVADDTWMPVELVCSGSASADFRTR
jgi:hypothetical protein